MWHNMREEPNVYINGRPYVLREDERPYKNLQEYSGIDYQRLQRMEVRALIRIHTASDMKRTHRDSESVMPSNAAWRTVDR